MFQLFLFCMNNVGQILHLLIYGVDIKEVWNTSEAWLCLLIVFNFCVVVYNIIEINLFFSWKSFRELLRTQFSPGKLLPHL